MVNAAKNFDTLATNLFYIITLIVQQNYFSDLYPAKILDLQQNHSFRIEVHQIKYMYKKWYKTCCEDYIIVLSL